MDMDFFTPHFPTLTSNSPTFPERDNIPNNTEGFHFPEYLYQNYSQGPLDFEDVVSEALAFSGALYCDLCECEWKGDDYKSPEVFPHCGHLVCQSCSDWCHQNYGGQCWKCFPAPEQEIGATSESENDLSAEAEHQLKPLIRTISPPPEVYYPVIHLIENSEDEVHDESLIFIQGCTEDPDKVSIIFPQPTEFVLLQEDPELEGIDENDLFHEMDDDTFCSEVEGDSETKSPLKPLMPSNLLNQDDSPRNRGLKRRVDDRAVIMLPNLSQLSNLNPALWKN